MEPDLKPVVAVPIALMMSTSPEVNSLVPPTFESYARLLHPARARDGSPARWADVAARSGGTVHALAQWVPMAHGSGAATAEPTFAAPASVGDLPAETVSALCDVLARHTTTSGDCYFGLWEGYGWIPKGAMPEARLELEHRSYLLLRGPLSGVEQVGFWMGLHFYRQVPDLWWPADRSWYVARDTDLDSTYVGGSDALVRELVADPRLEVWPVQSTDPIDAGSDPINRNWPAPAT